MTNTNKPVFTLTAAAASLLGLAGCASGSQHAASSSARSPLSSTAGTVGSSTPATTLSAWLADVIDGDYASACLKMAISPGSTATGAPVPITPASCTKTIPLGDSTTSPETILQDMHAAFTPASMSGHASVKVAPISATGSTATVDATQISVNGTPLIQVIVANSTGVTAQNTEVDFSLTSLRGTWYVSDFNLDF